MVELTCARSVAADLADEVAFAIKLLGPMVPVVRYWWLGLLLLRLEHLLLPARVGTHEPVVMCFAGVGSGLAHLYAAQT